MVAVAVVVDMSVEASKTTAELADVLTLLTSNVDRMPGVEDTMLPVNLIPIVPVVTKGGV